jgi:hypothetical protein
MSYARWGVNGSDVYVIRSEKWECVGCKGPGAYTLDTEEFLRHLDWHRDQGHTVPEYVYTEIRKDSIDGFYDASPSS